MLTNLIKWLKPEITQETEKSVLIKHALKNNDCEVEIDDTILFDKGVAGYGVYGQRQEALVLDYTETDAQVIYIIKGNKKTRWIPIYSITSNLEGEYRSNDDLIEMGLMDPKPQRAPNKPLLSGTYINEAEDDEGDTEFSLVEIDKVNGVYYIHNVGNANCQPINQDHEYTLHEFSSPEEGTYILDPGLYIRDDKLLHEVIPFQGTCWIRRLDYHVLTELTQNTALKLTRVETDEPTQGFYILGDPTQQDPTQQDPTQQDPTQQDPTQQDPTQQDPTRPDEPDEYLEPYKAPETKTGKCCGNPNKQDNYILLDLTHQHNPAHPTDPI